MKKVNGESQGISIKIEKNTVLFFDMDGTLVDTNLANYLSYKRAIQYVFQRDIDIPYNSNKRFNREELKCTVPTLTKNEYEDIIRKKEQFYKDYLPNTSLNEIVVDILTRYSKTNKTVLVTNCNEERALMTLDYHELTNKFSHTFYRSQIENKNGINKYRNAINSLSLKTHTIVVFENEKPEIDDAIHAGIPAQNILSI